MSRSLIIIPTYNERTNAIKMILEIEKSCPGVDLLFIDDGSPDGTAVAIKDMQREKPFVKLIERQGKLGLGTAYIRGFGWALENHYDKVLTMDCDFSHDPSAASEMLNLLDKNELVVGSRYINGIRIMNWPFERLLLSYGASLYTRIITCIPFLDPTGGFNAYTSRALQSLKLNEVFSVGYAFQIELKYKIWSKGFRCHEHPIVFWERTVGASKMGKNIIFEAVVNVIRLRMKKMFGTL